MTRAISGQCGAIAYRAAKGWPSALLQSLKSGRWRLACTTTPLIGRSYPQLRSVLCQLSVDQQHGLALAMKGAIGLARPPRNQDDIADLQPALLDAISRGLPAHAEAVLLQAATRDRFGRRHWLQPAACRAWVQMQQAARLDGIEFEIISSFRSLRDQCRILRRKLRQGLDWPQIVQVSAAPGYSEHHTGCAVDVATPGEPPLTENFEHSRAFSWLSQHAPDHDFHLSYPRGNRCGYVYEPWHWCYRPLS